MELKVKTKEWRYKTLDDGSKKVCGSYQVCMGKTEVASKEFNDGYSSIDIAMPSEILVKIEEIDELIKQQVVKFFKGE